MAGRRAALIVVALAALLAVPGCGGGDGPSPHRASPEIVYLRRLEIRAEVYETLSIRADGHVFVGKFIGEDTGIERYAWRLVPAARARLGRLLDATAGALRPTRGPWADNHRAYIFKLRGREVEAQAGRVARHLRPLVAFVDPLVDHPVGRPR